MDPIKQIKQSAKKIDATIILPEANIDERVKLACKKILKNKLSKIIVFGKVNEFEPSISNNKNCQIIDIENNAHLDTFASQLYELRKEKGVSIKDAKRLVKRADYFAMMMLKNGLADGVVAGAKWTTADTLRPALQIIKTKPDKNAVSGCVLMCKKGKEPLVFTDVSLIENPSSESLCEIAISGAEFYEKIIGKQPKIAMLSYSTLGSAKGEMVDKVKKATDLAKRKSKFLIDGEMQVDSALNKDIAHKKGLTSKVGGCANVLVFPDINAGNIGYKLATILAGYYAVGPIMLNFNKPVNDLSRGCNVDDIVNTVCITKLMV